MTVTPYGFLLVQFFSNDGPFSVKDYPGQVLQNHDGGAFLVSARGTRFGLKVAVPNDPLTGAKINGVIEGDFKGGFPQQGSSTTTCSAVPAGGGTPTCTTTTAVPGTSWYNALFRIRLGYASAEWGNAKNKLTLVLGQDWRIIAPLAPTSLAFGYDQLFTQAGNLNTRDPQLKAIYDVSLGTVGVNVSAAMLAPQDAFTGAPTGGVDYDAGIRSRIPNGEARVAVSLRDGGKKVAEVGVAGFLGPRAYNSTAVPLAAIDTTTRLGAVDAIVNLPFITLQGEGYLSDGAEDAYGGMITQAVIVNAPPGGRATSLTNLQSNGFWAQAVLKPIPWINVPVGYGMEQVRYKGLPASAVPARLRNSQFATGLLLNVTNPWKFGFEYVHTISGYSSNPGTVPADTFVFASKLDF